MEKSNPHALHTPALALLGVLRMRCGVWARWLAVDAKGSARCVGHDNKPGNAGLAKTQQAAATRLKKTGHADPLGGPTIKV
jgi:hypothetical protein